MAITDFFLDSSSDNTLTSNTASNNGDTGIWLRHSSSNNTLTDNTVNGSTYSGILVYDSSNNNTLTSNTANNNNWHGIYLHSSSNNTLNSNNACDNNQSGGAYYDIKDIGSNSGDNNTCTYTYNFTDASAFSGCVNICAGVTTTTSTTTTSMSTTSTILVTPVNITSSGFVSQNVTINVSGIVNWTNVDSAIHRIMDNNSAVFDSGNLSQDELFVPVQFIRNDRLSLLPEPGHDRYYYCDR